MIEAHDLPSVKEELTAVLVGRLHHEDCQLAEVLGVGLRQSC